LLNWKVASGLFIFVTKGNVLTENAKIADKFTDSHNQKKIIGKTISRTRQNLRNHIGHADVVHHSKTLFA